MYTLKYTDIYDIYPAIFRREFAHDINSPNCAGIVEKAIEQLLFVKNDLCIRR